MKQADRPGVPGGDDSEMFRAAHEVVRARAQLEALERRIDTA